MLRQSFIFLPRVAERTERRIWEAADDWNTFLSLPRIPGFSARTKHGHDQTILRAKQAVRQEDAATLANVFPARDHWRLYDEYKDAAAFLDIETGPYGDVSMVGVFDGSETRTYVQGINLDRRTLIDELARHRVLVTFNGRSFDVPVLKRWFNLRFDLPHIDLKHACAKIGLHGGLKSIEKQLGIKRPDSIRHVTGEDAAELWRCWKATGDRDFFDMLVTYNEEDCVNLKTVAERVIPARWALVRYSSARDGDSDRPHGTFTDSRTQGI